jgi:hypothetical protein
MHLDWIGLFKRYVGDEIRTPYFVPVARLSQLQAKNEIFVYTLFMAVLFGVIGVVSLSPTLPHGDTLSVSLYCFLVAGAAAAFGFTKHRAAAAICASAPIGMLIYFTIFGFHPNAGGGDKVLQVIIALLWVGYSWRIVQIARAYPSLQELPS